MKIFLPSSIYIVKAWLQGFCIMFSARFALNDLPGRFFLLCFVLLFFFLKQREGKVPSCSIDYTVQRLPILSLQ